MSIEELTLLLARIQVLDNRQVDQITIEAWAPLMEDVEYADAVDAVNAHFRNSTEYFKPAHVVKFAREASTSRRRARIEAARDELYKRVNSLHFAVLAVSNDALERFAQGGDQADEIVTKLRASLVERGYGVDNRELTP